MNTTVNMNNLSSMCTCMLEDRVKYDLSLQSSSFLKLANQLSGEAASAAAPQKSTSDMDIIEYKSYISNKISQLTIHQSRALDSISVKISDAGFEAMRTDPDYEKWVLNTLQEDFGNARPISGGSRLCTYMVGASEEEYFVQKVYLDPDAAEADKQLSSETGDSFWERRIESHKRFQELQKEAYLKRWLLQQKLKGGSASAAVLLSGLI